LLNLALKHATKSYTNTLAIIPETCTIEINMLILNSYLTYFYNEVRKSTSSVND